MVFVKKKILLLFMSLVYLKCISEKVTYLSLEHPSVTHVNPKFFSYFNLTSQRFGRKNPIYYVGIRFSNVVPLDNNIIVDFYMFEWLTNVYKRSFIEFHYTWCSLVEKDMLFGSAMRQGKLLGSCPFKPDHYNLVNMTVNPAFIPPGFPFTRGRIYCNLTQAKTKVRVGEGYIDMRVSQINKNVANKVFDGIFNR